MEALVQVDTHYTRSINLERDIDSNPILNAYIPTSKAMMVLDKIAATFNDQSMPRAWSLVGPYGSGKCSPCGRIRSWAQYTARKPTHAYS